MERYCQGEKNRDILTPVLILLHFKVMKEKGHLPFIDMAYQGFATGDLDRDAFGVRLLEREGLQPIVTQSCAKNLGLYGERTGAFHIVTASKVSYLIINNPVCKRIFV